MVYRQQYVLAQTHHTNRSMRQLWIAWGKVCFTYYVSVHMLCVLVVCRETKGEQGEKCARQNPLPYNTTPQSTERVEGTVLLLLSNTTLLCVCVCEGVPLLRCEEEREEK